MKKFAELFNHLEQTKSTKEKVAYIKNYFETTPPKDAVWALFFLSGNKLKRLITGRMLFDWCMEALSYPHWLMLESYSAVGDVAETIALLMLNQSRDQASSPLTLSQWIENRILPLRGESEEHIKGKIKEYWKELNEKEIFLLNKLLSGTLRIGTSHLLTLQGLSEALNISKEKLSRRLMGIWSPNIEFFESLKHAEDSYCQGNLNPYPFYLASPLDKELEELGDPKEWCAEWKWDGIRAQGVYRNGKAAIWSRRNELITDQFPEVMEAISHLKEGTVLDGEILAYAEGMPLLFGELQKRLGRKKVSQEIRKKVPVVFMIYDILEFEAKDVRKLPFIERLSLLNLLILPPNLLISPKISFLQWGELREKREESKKNRTEGLVIKKKNSIYGVGRRRGNWWKYKLDPKTIDVILLYAQPGQGWRANIYTDYTFGIWSNGELVPIAKAYSGLTQEEIYELDRWIRKNTVEKYGPVRKVKLEQVFEIAFEGIQVSNRHKSGVALRFPRIYRWRKDKLPVECDTLDSIRKEFHLES